MRRRVTAVMLLAAGVACLEARGEAAAGKPVYERLCASCHGLDGRGNQEKAKALKLDPRLLNLGRPEAANLTRQQLRTIVLAGKGKMPAYKAKLKPGEVDAVLDHVLGLASSLRDER